MADITEKQKIYILIAILGMAGLAVYYNFLLKPQFSKFMAKNKEFRVVKDRVKNEEVMISNEGGIKRQYENFEKQAEYLEKRLPGQDQVSSLLEGFSNVAESSGVKILKVKPLETPVTSASKQKAATEAYAEFPILIEARAGFHQLGDFVNKLENMDRFIKIMDIDITGVDKDPRRHDIKIRIVTYVLQ
ncbi:MAG: type 4a pilus biogenesis protein PilO [Candidatus Omnitrophota bacterium]|jgi:Tfp pilus assembly protein PilO